MRVAIAKFIGRVGVCGLMPKGPGTAGTLAAALFYAWAGPWSLTVHVAWVLGAFFLGWWASAVYAAHLLQEDPQEVCIDEVAGFWLACLGVSFTWQGIVAAFVLFRVLDIWKPFPIRTLDQKVTGGLGVMLDDMAAGGIAALVLHLLGLVAAHYSN